MATKPQGGTVRSSCADTKGRIGAPARGVAAPATDWGSLLRPERGPRVAVDPRTGGLLLRPTPLLVGEEVAGVPAGQLLTLGELCARLAGRFGADRACPLATAHSARVLAGVVAQDLREHRKPRWPIWRLVQNNGVLPPRWALDALYRASLLRAEGRRVTRAASGWRVA
jgi:hypothetical protein